MVEVTKDQLEARLLEEVIDRGGQTVTGIQIVEDGNTWRVVTLFDKGKEVPAKLVKEVEAEFKQIYSVAAPAYPTPRRARER